MPPDVQDLITEAAHEVKRIGGDMQKLHDSTQKSVADVHSRLDAIEVSFKRGGGSPLSASPETAEQREYKTAFENFVRTGEDTNLKATQRKALSTGSDPDGGYLVPTQLADRVVRKIFEISPLRQLANVQTVSGSEVELLVDADEAGASWVDETTPREETKTPQLGKKRIVVHELSASPLATQKLLEDSAINVDTWLGDKLSQRFARTEGAAFVKGTGVGQPRGFLTYPAGEQGEAVRQRMSGAGTGFPDGSGTADALLELVYALKAAYRANSSWLMPRSVQLKVRTLKDERGNY